MLVSEKSAKKVVKDVAWIHVTPIESETDSELWNRVLQEESLFHAINLVHYSFMFDRTVHGTCADELLRIFLDTTFYDTFTSGAKNRATAMEYSIEAKRLGHPILWDEKAVTQVKWFSLSSGVTAAIDSRRGVAAFQVASLISGLEEIFTHNSRYTLMKANTALTSAEVEVFRAKQGNASLGLTWRADVIEAMEKRVLNAEKQLKVAKDAVLTASNELKKMVDAFENTVRTVLIKHYPYPY